MNSNATLKIQENFRKKNSKRNKKAKRSCPESNELCEAGYGKGRQSPGSNCGAETIRFNSAKQNLNLLSRV